MKIDQINSNIGSVNNAISGEGDIVQRVKYMGTKNRIVVEEVENGYVVQFQENWPGGTIFSYICKNPKEVADKVAELLLG